ncbi:cytidylyltransferase domain-containing protein [Desulfosporosinus sp. BICA1-9]|uniref:acylneuraminate cytidylyltransferase family protein n=1 Tax=Desulfosporosinus sp. BICA1-9 TaxID=1531958 RepID=UPI00054B9C7A|nr:acylneuraminate cytidylyltransferase family protein [Desulfosporosinus sp. BICA1-9]KJS47412.1 MAG: CMP-N-acetlyneuraminic acid synthetase [Peptococcaceae bacterium BRH_c23]KJS89852.1 MAG: CMP-N-acetlyneuraminic acid synthetase [Desulfosporosinus sp. BICA1-9]HBW34975.1 acylneuraminate cytidylyltransferase family protein [Desulfosporosinus sp.]
MFYDHRIIAIIPARSGSKGLPDKNIRILNGKPLIAYSIIQAQEAGIFDEIFLSTDSQEYASIAIQYGANVPFLRSDELASDSASTWDCVREALEQYHTIGKEYDIFVVLQPTSPLRTTRDIINVIKQMVLTNADSVVSVCEADHSPLWYNTLPENKSLKGFVRSEIMAKTRQELPTFFRINGAIYAVSTSYFLRTQNIYDGNSFAYVMPKERSIDIDTLYDFSLAEYLHNLKM